MRVILEICDGPKQGHRAWLSHDGVLTVGRSARADFVVGGDQRMSGLHFAVELRGDACRLRDLGSTNGTFLDGERIREVGLTGGVQIRAGATTFSVTVESAMPHAQLDEPAAVAPSDPLGERNGEASASGGDAPPEDVQKTLDFGVSESSPPAVFEAAAKGNGDRPGNFITLPGQTPEGQYILSVLVKRTYRIEPGRPCVRAEEDQKLVPGDTHWGDPMNTSVKAESDFVPFKLATDVVVIGYAYAAGGTPATTSTASVGVGPVYKAVDVIGDRRCQHRPGKPPLFTDPTAFRRVALRYELAYGGVDIHSDPQMPCAYGRNHLGLGFAVKNTRAAVHGLRLPNLEDPEDRLVPERVCAEEFWQWERQPLPAGFGWYSKYWHPRAGFAGVLPADREAEQELRAIYATALPPDQKKQYEEATLPDMDFRFFNGASLGLGNVRLQGDEAVELRNLSPGGELRFQLPGEVPGVGIDIGHGFEEPERVLHTVVIRPEDEAVDLVWRAALPYDGPDCLPNLTKLEVVVL